MNAYWTNAPTDQANASGIVAEMERTWRECRESAVARPGYVVLPPTMPVPRRVRRWRGRRFVVAAHSIPTLDWFRALGVVFDGR
ncbi:hypothetical protein [Novilysobacter erysipheiresistens]|uniref:Uncharacterized protein n=1 Tax=Novilysobacter erysipheiresistens TaxID=1749332 RepID=A0ABU7YUC2_9GAMM